MTVTMIGRFREDRNSTSVSYKKYDQISGDVYPTFSICFKGNGLYHFNDTAIFEAFGINPGNFEMLLQGQNAFQYIYDPSSKLYNKTPISSTLKLDGAKKDMVQNSFNLSGLIKEASFVSENPEHSIFYGYG